MTALCSAATLGSFLSCDPGQRAEMSPVVVTGEEEPAQVVHSAEEAFRAEPESAAAMTAAGTELVERSPNGVEVSTSTVLATADGLVAETREWRLGDRSGRAWHVSMALPGRVSVTGAARAVAFDSLLPANDEGSWVAVNGGFYDTDGEPMGVVISDGVVLHEYAERGGSGVLEVTSSGPRIVHRSEHVSAVSHGLQSIDRIVADGESLVTVRVDARAAARTAVAISSDRVTVVVLAERASIVGRGSDVRLVRTSGHGLPLWAFAEYLVLTTDAEDALNLDGAVSTQLAARIGATSIRVRGERGTPNAVVLRGAEGAGGADGSGAR